MKPELIEKIFNETAYVRTGGSKEELKTAEYLKNICESIGVPASIENFEVDMATINEEKLTIDGEEINCKGYLRESDKYSLSKCKDKIVMIDGYLGAWRYRDMLENGAVGFITYDGNVNFVDRDIDRRELRSYVSEGKKIVGVNINAKDAVDIINNDGKIAKITLNQNEYKGSSQNVIAEIKGQSDEWIVFTAHYDSTSLSQGAYDNMSGCIGLVGIMEHFKAHTPRYNLRFIFCGSVWVRTFPCTSLCMLLSTSLRLMYLQRL